MDAIFAQRHADSCLIVSFCHSDDKMQDLTLNLPMHVKSQHVYKTNHGFATMSVHNDFSKAFQV